jgi:thymidylate synthase (FAD)
MTNDDQRRIAYQWEQGQLNLTKQAQELYTWAISKGIAKEQARAVLPEGLTMSRLYVNGTLRSWIHYIDVRADESTQLEHREIALECAKVIAKVFPLMSNL